MGKITSVLFAFLLLSVTACSPPSDQKTDDVYSYALSRKGDLQLSVFVTAQAVMQFLATDEGRREMVSLMKANGITRAYLEVYRSEVVSTDLLKTAAGFLKQNGFEVVGGIATVPGKDFGVRQANTFKLYDAEWFNYENKKTQNDLRTLMEEVAPVFDAFIIDDFLCTSDATEESAAAKGDRDWGTYRRDLLTEISKTVFIDPAKKANPNIRMIIKYPQWYDRYHLFGYDVVREPELYDEVRVGTEARGQYTASFGYVQSYQSFVVYRWLTSLSRGKMGGAWFDHIDCDANDFIDQAYQSVLGGAKELILFNYFNITEGHRGQHLLRLQYHHLADLAAAVAATPVSGAAGYKPPHSDAKGNLYIMDYVGMLGIPLIPVSDYPAQDDVIFLPTHANDDPDIYEKVTRSIEEGKRMIFTSGFLANLPQGEELAARAGVRWPVSLNTIEASEIVVDGRSEKLELPLLLDADIAVTDGTVLLDAMSGGKRVPFLTQSGDGNLFVWNVHTFSNEDFEAAGEMLLAPEPLALVSLPREWVNTIRASFNEKLNLIADAPTRVAIQPFGNDELMVTNYNREAVTVTVPLKGSARRTNVFTGEEVSVADGATTLTIPARGRVWVK